MNKRKKNTKSKKESGNSYSIIFIISVFCIFILTLSLVLVYRQKGYMATKKDDEVYQIIYQYSGNAVDYAKTMLRTVHITNTGAVNISSDNAELPSADYMVNKEAVKKLKEHMLDGGFLKMKDNLSKDDCADDGQYYLGYKDSTNDKKVGGRCVTDRKFIEFIDEIDSLVADQIEDYENQLSSQE